MTNGDDLMPKFCVYISIKYTYCNQKYQTRNANEIFIEFLSLKNKIKIERSKILKWDMCMKQN